MQTFIVGDRSHARSGEIYAKLDELGKERKNGICTYGGGGGA